MKKLIFFLFLFLIAAIFGVVFFFKGEGGLLRPVPEKKLAQYSFISLKERNYPGSEIVLDQVLSEEADCTSSLFYFYSEGKKVSGMINLPKSSLSKKQPVVVMLRGYADEEIYFTGLGTRKAASFFCDNGFITLAPDFLGFGESDRQSQDILEARFEKPVTVLNLLASIPSLEKADNQRLFLWAHSNGGQIALSVLAIWPKSIPTTLWAPVTKGFPESVLAYVGEMDDQGEKVKKTISDFLLVYNPGDFSVDHFFSDIVSPILVQQGTVDQLVPVSWSDDFVKRMKGMGKKISYYQYPNDDHNLTKSWSLVVSRDLAFFKKF